MLIDSLIAGGAERLAVDAAAALDPGRYVPHLLVTRHSGPLEDRVREAGLAYTVLGRRRGFRPTLFLRARRIVRGSDLLHAHKFAGSAWGALLAGSAGRPLVAHEHTFDGVSRPTRKIVYRAAIAPCAARIVCVSSGVAASLRADGVAADKLTVIPNAVTISETLSREAARAELGLPPSAHVVGMVARLRPEKQHALALEALAALRDRDVPCLLCVVGDGPLADPLRAQAEALRVADRVVWAGERRDAQRLMKAFDTLLLCSSYEGMPLAALEALVAGVPVVSTAVGAMPELLEAGGGLIVPDDSPASIADGVVAAFGAPISGDALDALQLRYGIDRLADDLMRLYDTVLTS